MGFTKHRGKQAHDEEGDEYVLGPIRWLSDNPGRQLMTGSFHPVDDNQWDDGVYLEDALCTLLLRIMSCAHATCIG